MMVITKLAKDLKVERGSLQSMDGNTVATHN